MDLIFVDSVTAEGRILEAEVPGTEAVPGELVNVEYLSGRLDVDVPSMELVVSNEDSVAYGYDIAVVSTLVSIALVIVTSENDAKLDVAVLIGVPTIARIDEKNNSHLIPAGHTFKLPEVICDSVTFEKELLPISNALRYRWILSFDFDITSKLGSSSQCNGQENETASSVLLLTDDMTTLNVCNCLYNTYGLPNGNICNNLYSRSNSLLR